MESPKRGDKMKSNFWILSSMICFVFVSPLLGQQLVKRVGEVKYISQQSYYINLGTKQGLKAGDILNVRRNGRLIGRLIVENVARNSSSCKLLNQTSIIKKGDRAEIFVPNAMDKSPIKKAQTTRKAPKLKRNPGSRKSIMVL